MDSPVVLASLAVRRTHAGRIIFRYTILTECREGSQCVRMSLAADGYGWMSAQIVS